MDRRNFLKRGTFFTVAAATGTLAACGSSDDDSASAPAPSGPAAGTYLFAQGVASGDPRDTSVVFWTRCTHADASSTADIDLTLQVAATSDFASPLVSVPLTATATYDFTVRCKVTTLPASTPLYYRFVAGADTSAVGQSKTAPAADATVAQVNFGSFTCQDWSINHWGAMSLMAEESFDFLVHVGDYIYETVGASFQVGAAEAAHTALTLPDGTALPGGGSYATTLDDYRYLYRTYRGDARLQALHAKFAIIPTWDDHEFSDDCWQDHQTYTNANLQQTARRRAANQAWVEYMPLDFGDVDFDPSKDGYETLQIYRDFHFGTLLHLVMTDERLYRDDHTVPEAAFASLVGGDPVNGDNSIGSRYFVQQPLLAQFEAGDTQQLGHPPSILGADQTDWWKQTMLHSTAAWRLWGNEVMMNRFWVDTTQIPGVPAQYQALYVVNADSWDGYPTHKNDVLGYLSANNIGNVVAITGDLHAFQCGTVSDANGTPVLVDFVCAGVSSSSFYTYLHDGSAGTPFQPLIGSAAQLDAMAMGNNPGFAYVDHDAQGYASATLTAAQLVVTYNKVAPLNSDGSLPSNLLAKRTRITLPSGSTTPTVEDNV